MIFLKSENMSSAFILMLVWIFALQLAAVRCSEIDPKGYIMYCPCMGRFGNQADHFLGALAFSKGLDRTLILPPWVEYRKGHPKSIQIPFDSYFNVSQLGKYHRVITMEKFFDELADQVWPASKRISFCYTSRESHSGGGIKGQGVCNAKNGNPFGPFWDTFNVDFIGSQTYGPLHYDVHHTNVAKDWNEKFPPSSWPVLAFTGAPAPYPVQKDNVPLHQYLIWKDDLIKKAKDFIKYKLPEGPFIGIHLRNGIDWERACEHVIHSSNLFASAQCLGYQNENGRASTELCLPSDEIIIRQLRRTLHKTKAKSIFVASDHDHMIEKFNKAFVKEGITAQKLDIDNPHLDLAILSYSNHFIGNCVSSFSAFVKRERDHVFGVSSSFWAFPNYVKPSHHEL